MTFHAFGPWIHACAITNLRFDDTLIVRRETKHSDTSLHRADDPMEAPCAGQAHD